MASGACVCKCVRICVHLYACVVCVGACMRVYACVVLSRWVSRCGITVCDYGVRSVCSRTKWRLPYPVGCLTPLDALPRWMPYPVGCLTPLDALPRWMPYPVGCLIPLDALPRWMPYPIGGEVPGLWPPKLPVGLVRSPGLASQAARWISQKSRTGLPKAVWSFGKICVEGPHACAEWASSAGRTQCKGALSGGCRVARHPCQRHEEAPRVCWGRRSASREAPSAPDQIRAQEFR